MSASPQGVAYDIVVKHRITQDDLRSEEGRRHVLSTIQEESWGLPPNHHHEVLEHIKKMV